MEQCQKDEEKAPVFKVSKPGALQRPHFWMLKKSAPRRKDTKLACISAQALALHLPRYDPEAHNFALIRSLSLLEDAFSSLIPSRRRNGPVAVERRFSFLL